MSDRGTPLMPEDEALECLLGAVRPLHDSERVATLSALGRTLARALISTLDIPPADRSTMDGFALRHRDVATDGDTRLPVWQRLPAGTVPEPQPAGTAARIFTGALLPAGTDTVVAQENCRYDDGEVTILHQAQGSVSPGENVLRRGADIGAGQTLLEGGHRLRPQDMGLAASVGAATLQVYRRLRVAILSSGDELRNPDDQDVSLPTAALAPGEIYNANRYTLNGLLAALGCEVLDLGTLPDDRDQIHAALQHAADNADLVISSGGASIGEEDHMRAVIEETGELHLWKLAIKPGKPLLFGQIDATPVIGLPGNPVSTFVTFVLYARPVILKMQGCNEHASGRRSYPVTAGFNHRSGSRREFLRARLEARADGTWVAHIHPDQSSAVLSSTSWAEGLIQVAEHSEVRAGSQVAFIPFTELW